MMNKAKDKEWKIYFDKNFLAKSGKEPAQQELQINKKFVWDDVLFYVPAIYVCKSSIIVDICMEAEPLCVKQFIEKYDMYKEQADNELEMLLAENPLNWDIDMKLKVNGVVLKNRSGSGVSWLPSGLLQDEKNDREAERVMQHYQLDQGKAWGMHRVSFEWEEAPVALEKIELILEQRPVKISGCKFTIQEEGEQKHFLNPVTGREHTLIVDTYEDHHLRQEYLKGLAKADVVYPSHFKTMTYMLEPDLQDKDFFVKDCSAGNAPRKAGDKEKSQKGAASVAVIGCSNGPVSIFVTGKAKKKKIHTVCSSLYFDPVEKVEWKIGFYSKIREDITVKLR